MLSRLTVGALLLLIATTADAGPACTFKYPQGFTAKLDQRPTCGLDAFGIAWGHCARRTNI